MSDLNPAQQQAVQHLDGPLLVLAGAGSGKTRVITEKIARLLATRRLLPDHLCAVTFTNKAAREMKARLAERLDRAALAALRVSTFHRLGLDIFRAECTALGYKPRFSILDAADSQMLLREAMAAETVTEAGVDAMAACISRWKSALVMPEEAAARATDALELDAARIYVRYQRALRAYNAVDFDDLLALPVRLLQEDEARRAAWRHRIRYLLVDEYQDTNHAQYALLRVLAGEAGQFTVVGDDDQSIYAWRGAQVENLQTLARDWPTLSVVKLEQNYRCSQRILNVANRLISGNPHVYAKRLWSAAGHGDPVRVISAQSANDEAERIAGEILTGHRANRHRWGDYAVLYRSNHQARVFEQALRDLGIPYVISGGTSFFDRAEVKDVMAYLRLAVNPDDDAAFLRIVNVPRREIGTQTLERVGAYASSREISLLSSLWEIGLRSVVSARAWERLSAFARLMSGLVEAAEDTPPATLARSLLADIGYVDWLRDSRPDPRAVERAQQHLDELLGWLERMATRLDGGSLAEVLNHLALMDRLSREDEDDDDAVRLMTLHAAKGLEFERVYLVGVEEELLPHRNSEAPDQVEEERRLAYVGITRARRSLALSYAQSRSRHGQQFTVTPSRFLEEIRGDDVVFESETRPKTAVEKRARADDNLSRLRSLLSEG
ncbi:MAG: UvrD-helicase domain-containing protein [Gammaproteobacteria bacterium]|nr:UvrD-helicase domain-containing protein [Gammaproteobacteria bacterium]TVQ44772.1 MAG: ATP-dependent DNA helicase Rep [Gammaproteobacteria bacterium]